MSRTQRGLPDHLVSCVPAQSAEDLRTLHMYLSVILRVINSKSSEVDLEEFGGFCTQCYVHILSAFPWVKVTGTVHKILAHSAEMIEAMGGKGLGTYSEEGLEATNKILRRVREHLTRKTSFRDNIWDLYVRMWTRSDPNLIQYRRKVPKRIKSASPSSEEDSLVARMLK